MVKQRQEVKINFRVIKINIGVLPVYGHVSGKSQPFYIEKSFVEADDAETITIVVSGLVIDRVFFVIVGITIVTVYVKGKSFQVVSVVEPEQNEVVAHGIAIEVESRVFEAGN
jgi:hypothetical protein